MPVVGKFFTAIQAGNIGARNGGRSREALAGSFCNRKAEVLVAATEQHIKQIRHKSPTHPEIGFPKERYLAGFGTIVLQDMS